MLPARAGAPHTRVAVVQLAYHPAVVVGRRSPLEDPGSGFAPPPSVRLTRRQREIAELLMQTALPYEAIGERLGVPGGTVRKFVHQIYSAYGVHERSELVALFDPKRDDSLAPEGELSAPLYARLDALRRRIREAYDAQVLGKVRAVLDRCRAWGARIVVFPEYSIPWEILGGVADAAGDMVVVAGTHTVDQAAKKSGVYERLVTPARAQVGQALCPVLHRGRLLALQAKLNPSVAERDMRAGEAWAPVAMPDGVPGPMGVLVCLDFLFREGEQHRALVADALAACRFLAVPSLTPTYTLPEFAGKAWEEARRYGRPVLYADGAEGGGTSVYVDEGQAYDLRRFPDRAGYLEAGDEGVIVADVNLGYARAGRSTRYDEPQAVVPVAEATFVYRSHAVGLGYAQWLEETEALAARDDDDALDALAARVERDRDLLLNAGALSGAKARGRRMARLVREIGKVTRVEEVRQFTREVVMPGDLLPLGDVRAAMAGAAADVVFGWLKEREARAAGFAEVEERLRKAVDAGVGSRSWTSEGTTALAAVGQAVRGPAEREEKTSAVPEPVRVVLPAGIDPAALGVQRHGGWVLVFRARPEDFGRTMREGRPGEDGLPSLSEPAIRAGRDLVDLAQARGADRVATVLAFTEGEERDAFLLVALFRGDCWLLWTPGRGVRLVPQTDALLAAVRASGLGDALLVPLPPSDLDKSVASLLPHFDGGRETAKELLAQRLAEVGGNFVEPDARVGDGEAQPVLEALDAWLAGGEQTALVLGEFGSGKSTVLAAWACRVWERNQAPLPLLVSLAGASASASAEVLLLKAAQVEDTTANRAALRLLVRRRLLVPCFDGLDEMATRLDATDLAGRLSALLETAQGGGKVVVSSRDNYFPTEAHLRSSADTALASALGASAGLTRMVVQPLTDAQVRVLVGKVRKERAQAALDHISRIYDLSDLVHRPLLLGMVLATLERLDPAAKVGRADLYEAYLGRWLDQTRSQDPECFTDEQKKDFAEALAEQLWRSGATSCTWQDLQLSVHMRLRQHLPENMPLGAAFLEIQGGAFFVHEGEDKYRFAHKSFLEYFFARALVATLSDRPLEALATKPMTAEVAGFVGEILRREGDPRESWTVRAVQMWLTGTWQPQVGAAMAATMARAPLEATAEAAANALRLLLSLSRWAGDKKGWIPEGADLRKVELVREDLSGAVLVRADLSGANLAGSDLSGADLTQANLERACLRGVRLGGTVLTGARAQRVDFAYSEADKARIDGADLTGASLRQSTWTACRWDGACAEGAEATAWVALDHNTDHVVSVLPPEAAAVLTTGHQGAVNAVAWHPDGKRLASAGSDGTVRLWDAATHQELARLEGHQFEVNAVVWHPDGRRLASAGDDRTVRLWDAATHQELARLEGHQHVVNAVVWHPDGKRLASAGSDGTVRLWDAATYQELARLEGHQNRVRAVVWHPDGKRLASAGNDGTVRLWDAATHQELARLQGHRDQVRAVVWHPDGKRLASAGSDGTVRLWDAATYQELARLEGHRDQVRAVVWHPDGKHLASAGSDSTLRLWDAVTHQELARLEGHRNGVMAVVWHPDGKRLASAGSDGTVRLWDAVTHQELARLEGHQDRSVAVVWHPDGKCLASAGSDGTVRLWDAATHQELARLEGHRNWVRAVVWHPDGQRLASAGSDGTVRLWDATTHQELARLEGHRNGVMAVVWHPDGKRLASAGDDGTVRLWDAATHQELARLEGHRRWVMAVVWHPDGKRLVSAGYDGTLRLWDAATHQELARLEGHQNRVMAVVWHPDGKRLASAGSDGTVRLWDAATHQELARLEGHQDGVMAVVWHPDGKRLASAGDDGTVRLWDTATHQELARLEGHPKGVSTVVWHPDGKRLASAGDDGIIRIWDADRARLLCTLEAAGNATLFRTPGGFCVFGDRDRDRHHLAVRRPEPDSRTVLYLPLAGLRDVLHRPDKVAAALAGDLSGDDLRPELARLGWNSGLPWDGEEHFMPSAPPSPPPPSRFMPAVPPEPPPPAPVFALVAAQAFFGTAAPLASPAALTAIDPPIENPFHPGRALVEAVALPGREPVISELLALIASRNPAVLRGPRRSGKTSILFHLKARLLSARLAHRDLEAVDFRGGAEAGSDAQAHEGRIHHVTLEGKAPLRTAGDLAVCLDPSLRGDPSPADALRRRFAAERGTILLLDEIANLQAADPSVFAWLRAVGQETTSVVLAGSPWDWVRVVEQAARQPGSSFGNDVTPVDLGPLDRDDALRFLADTAPPDVPLPETTTALWIVERCGPWPFYLQVMGYAVVQDVRAGRRRALVEPEGVSDLYEQRLLLDRDAAAFGTRWAELPGRAQHILRALRGGAELPRYRDLSRDDRKALRDTGLCNAHGHWLADPPFYDWIRRVGDVDEG